MRTWSVLACLTLLPACLAFPQQPATKAHASSQSPTESAEAKLKGLLESKVRAEWDAFKNKDKKAYGALLADDFIAVETDGEGARNKVHAVNEIDRSALRNYSLFGFQLISSDPHASVVTYEVTMEFPPKSTVRFLRVWVSELWLNRDGQWKARYYQETRVK